MGETANIMRAKRLKAMIVQAEIKNVRKRQGALGYWTWFCCRLLLVMTVTTWLIIACVAAAVLDEIRMEIRNRRGGNAF